MKKLIIIVLIFMFLYSVPVNAIDMWKLAFNSAVETDRYQSYEWHFATRDNPVISPNGYKVYELNPLVAGTNREQFNTRVDIAKITTNQIRDYNKFTKLTYKIITVIELYNVYRNNNLSKTSGFPQVYMISYNFKF